MGKLQIDYARFISDVIKLNDKSRYNIEKILSGLVNLNNVNDSVWKKQASYILATIYHETAGTFLPIEEYGKGKGKPYGQYLDIDRSKYNNLNHLYYGRGFVQITWLSNYVRARKEIGVDFVNKPELALDFDNAIKIANYGMVEGWFTGRTLDRYINAKITDYVGARYIINGNDKAIAIAGYAKSFELAIY